jgi:hypothetical protein
MATLEELMKRAQGFPGRVGQVVRDDWNATRNAYQQGGILGAAGDVVRRGATGFYNNALNPVANHLISTVQKTGGDIASGYQRLGQGLAGNLPAAPPNTMKPDRRAERASAIAGYSTGGYMEGPTPPPGPLGRVASMGIPDADSANPGLPYLPDQDPSPITAAMTPPGQSAVLPVSGFPGVYRNSNPGAEYGNALYSDSVPGARGFSGGAIARATTGSGPFGRTGAEQQAIDDRVGSLTRAADMYREMRGSQAGGTMAGMPTERDRLQRRARQQVSLNQGLGAFLNQAGDRNYARDELLALDAREEGAQAQQFDAMKAYTDMVTKQREMMNDERRLGISQQQADQGRYHSEVDPLTGEMRVLDKSTGQFLPLPAEPMTPESAATTVDEEIKALGGGGWFGRGTFPNGESEDQYRARRLNELMAPQGSGLGNYTEAEITEYAQQPDVQSRAAEAGMDPVEFVKEFIRMRLEGANGA